jgi:hypothetical protein
MWTQVYLHHVRQVYDLHLADFLHQWLPGGKFSIGLTDHLRLTDNEVNTAMSEASRCDSAAGHHAAKCITGRGHFRRLYQENFRDRSKNLQAFELLRYALEERYTADKIKHKRINQRSEGKQFPVLMSSGDCENSINLSPTLASIPVVSSALIFVHPEVREDAKSWISTEKERILTR